MTKPGKLTAREYLRVSLDRSGRARSINEQHDDNSRAAEQQEWKLGEPYRDKGSASRYATKARDGYDQLVADLRSDRFGAEVLMLWESSRGSRTVGEWATLIDLCEAQSIRIHVTTHNRTYDPANGRDRRSMHEDAVDSEYESAKISERARRAARADAADGKPHGPIPYGYQRTYDPKTRRFIAQTQEPAEAQVIRELFDRVRRGHSIRSIAVDFETRGIRSRTGKVFSPQYLRWFLTNPRYAGQRLHIAGRGNGSPRPGEGEITKGKWEALVDKPTWLAVQRILSAPERKTVRPGRAVHLLSMIGRCDPCGGRLAVGKTKEDGRAYRCHAKGCVQVDEVDLDDYAERVIIGYLSRPDNVERLTRPDSDDSEITAVREQIATIRAELDDLADKVGRGELSATLAARAEPAIQERLRAAERRQDELSTPPILRGLLTPGKDVARRWKAAPMSAKREVARLLLSPEMIGELRVTRKIAAWRRDPVEDRVVWRRS